MEHPAQQILHAALRGCAALAVCAALVQANVQPSDPLFRPGAECDYLIIAPDDGAFLAEARKLATEKTREGLRTRIETVNVIVNTYEGIDSAGKIWSFLQHAWTDWGVTWVLLAGDYSQVPARTMYVPAPNPELVVSDAYYACLEGTWDANRNGFYGDDPRGSFEIRLLCGYDDFGVYRCEDKEVLFSGMDIKPDIYLGRLPASTAGELAVMIDKIISYEHAPRGEAGASDVLLFGPAMDARKPGYNYITDVAYHFNYDIKPILRDEASLMKDAVIDEVYEDSVTWYDHVIADTNLLTVERVATALNRGPNLVMFSAHGSSTRVQLSPTPPPAGDPVMFTIADVRALSSPFPANFISNSCHVMNLTEGAGTCFAKELLVHPHGGAVSFAGAAGNDLGPWAIQIQKATATYICKDRITRPGKAATLAVSTVLQDESFARQFWGDPEMDMWTRCPGEDDTLAISVRRTPANLSVDVMPALDSVLVCITGATGIFLRGYTKGGTVELDTVPADAESLLVTATVHGLLPSHLFVGSSRDIAGARPASRDPSRVVAGGVVLRGRMLTTAEPAARVLLHAADGRFLAAATSQDGGRTWVLPPSAARISVVRVESPAGTRVARVRVGK